MKEKGIVYYTKTLNLDYKQGANLVFHLYLTTNRNKTGKAVFSFNDALSFSFTIKFFRNKVFALT